MLRSILNTASVAATCKQNKEKIKNVGGREGGREKEREGERERESERAKGGKRESGGGGGKTWLAGPPRMFVGVIVCSVCAVVK